MAIAIVVALFTLSFRGMAKDRETIGIAPSGNFGLDRLLFPTAPSRHLSLSAHGGYGFIESMGSVSGAHHRLKGQFAISGAPIPELGLSLSMVGNHDRHPKDDDGKDVTTVGAPKLGIRGGANIGKWVGLGAAIDVTVPGNNAPSLEFGAAILDSKLLFAIAPKRGTWRLLLKIGYRWDNSNKTAPDPATLRPGDRISIGTSAFDAVLLGLGTSVSISKVELLAELTSNLYVGSGAPTDASPVQLSIGARYRVLHALQLSLLTETLLTGRPKLDESAPIMPVEPRFSIIAGLSYSFGLRRSSPSPLPMPVPTLENEPVPEVEPTSDTAADTNTSSIEGSTVDEEGNPIGGTSVKYVTDVSGQTKEFETTTGPDGAYSLTNLPAGEGTLVIRMEGFDPVETPVTLTGGSVVQEPSVLTESVVSSPTQLRGQIRSIDGTPLVAKLVIKPGNQTVETDDTGYFSIDLPKGQYRVTISAAGHKSQKKRVVIEENSVTIINIDLRKKN